MSDNKNITLQEYADQARKEFDTVDKRLSLTGVSFSDRMDGRSGASLVFSAIGTLLWLAAFTAGYFFVRDSINSTMLLVACCIVAGLILFMFIDNILDFSYYGRIAAGRAAISQLRSRISHGRDAIASNHQRFLGAEAQGWNLPLAAAPSIPDKARSIETTTASLLAVKRGFLNIVKNVFFFLSVAAVAIVGCIALFPVGESIMEGISGDQIPDDTVRVLNIIASVIALIGALILAKLMWGLTDCSVNGVTLFVTLAGPLVYLALIALGTLIVHLVILAISVILAILGVVVALAVLFGCLCGS